MMDCEHKTCTECGISKPITEFAKSKKRLDGTYTHKSICSECLSKKFKEYWKKKKEDDPSYYNKRCELQRVYQKNNSDKLKEYKKEYRNKVKELNPIYPSCTIRVNTCKVTGKLFVSRKMASISKEGWLILERERNRKLKLAGREIRTCIICGKKYDYFNYEGHEKTCSDECKRRRRHQVSKPSKIKRNALLRRRRALSNSDLGWHQNVNPIKVFDRDKWKCCICGKPTPKKLRGTREDNAPELDHIIPLSMGGMHTYTNTQCLCRSCNNKKSNKLIGQIRLCM